MNRKSLIMLLFVAISVSSFAGCDGPPDVESSGGLYAPISTHISSPVSEAWTNAEINGEEYEYPPPCSPSLDENCLESIYGFTGSTGIFNAFTDALPAGWNISATDSPGYQTCPAGSGYTGTLTTVGLEMNCGMSAIGNATISPATCFVGGTTNPCPATVTLTISDTTMPTSHAMTVGAYSSTAANISTNSETASSPTVITAPTPTPSIYINGVASVVINVIDPTTSSVLASGVMTFFLPTTPTCPTKPLNPPDEAVTPNAACTPAN